MKPERSGITVWHFLFGKVVFHGVCLNSKGPAGIESAGPGAKCLDGQPRGTFSQEPFVGSGVSFLPEMVAVCGDFAKQTISGILVSIRSGGGAGAQKREFAEAA